MKSSEVISPRKLTFNIITPIATRRYGDETSGMLSGSAIKGILRWWYRVLSLESGDLSDAIKYEPLLFGFSGKMVSPIEIYVDASQAEYPSALDILTAAYWKNFRIKSYSRLIYNGKISVWLVPNPKIINNEKIRDLLEPAMCVYESLFEVISLLGGIGAAWRRGLGSIMLEKHSQINSNEYEECVRKTIENALNNIRSFMRTVTDNEIVKYLPEELNPGKYVVKNPQGVNVKIEIGKGDGKKGVYLKDIHRYPSLHLGLLDLNWCEYTAEMSPSGIEDLLNNCIYVSSSSDKNCGRGIVGDTLYDLKRQIINHVKVSRGQKSLSVPQSIIKDRLIYGLPTSFNIWKNKRLYISVPHGRFPSRFIVTIKIIDKKSCLVAYRLL